MKSKQKQMKQEGGITLIALIITIIVLVILAAVTLNSIFGSNIVGIATNGAINYAEEQQKELGMLNDVSDMLGDITGDTDRPMSPSITLSGTKGNNDIYTSNVIVTISINKGLEQTGTIKLHYKINDGEEQITEEDVSFEVDTEGTTKITAWTENEKGNLSNNAETIFTITTKKDTLSETELAMKIGDYVDYTPVSGNFTSEAELNGYEDQEFSTIENLKWRIFDASNGILTLISDTTANSDFYLRGPIGATNEASLLDNACMEMYSNDKLGGIGRSFHVEDFETHSSVDISELAMSLTPILTTLTSENVDDAYLELFIYQPGTTSFTNSYIFPEEQVIGSICCIQDGGVGRAILGTTYMGYTFRRCTSSYC